MSVLACVLCLSFTWCPCVRLCVCQYVPYTRAISATDPIVVNEEHYTIATGKLLESLAFVEAGGQGKQVPVCGRESVCMCACFRMCVCVRN